MDDAGLKGWLALIRTPRFGAATLRKLLNAPGAPKPEYLAGTSSSRLRSWGATEDQSAALSEPDWQRIERDEQWLAESPYRHLIPLTDERFPARLREIPSPPLALFALGDLDLLHKPALAIVGSRNPSTAGRQTAHAFARHLAEAGIVIVSGLAEGIDAAAHEGALAGQGMTLAITGTGLDRVYPARTRDLAHRIADKGILISEFPPGTEPRPGHFPRRNRLIAGLGMGVLVVEAAEQSGSLITARLANEAGREIFAIPGSIHNPLARGCHKLIRQGAKLVETADDILEELAPLLPAAMEPPRVTRDKDPEPETEADYRALLDTLGYDPIGIDSLVGATGLTAAEVSSMLLVLELRGHVAAYPGGRYGRIRPDSPA